MPPRPASFDLHLFAQPLHVRFELADGGRVEVEGHAHEKHHEYDHQDILGVLSLLRGSHLT